MQSRSSSPGGDLLLDGVPVVEVGAVDGGRAHAQALGCGHLVAHEGQEGRHHQRGPGAGLPAQLGGDEVDGRLPEPGALHHQGPSPVAGGHLDGGQLLGAQPGVRPGQGLQQLLGPLGERGAPSTAVGAAGAGVMAPSSHPPATARLAGPEPPRGGAGEVGPVGERSGSGRGCGCLRERVLPAQGGAGRAPPRRSRAGRSAVYGGVGVVDPGHQGVRVGVAGAGGLTHRDDVDPGDGVLLGDQGRLDAHHQVLHLGAGEPVVDVHPGHDPDLGGAGEGHHQVADVHHPWPLQQDAGHRRLALGRHLLAHQEVAVALDEEPRHPGQDQTDGDRGQGIRDDRPGDLVETDAHEGEHEAHRARRHPRRTPLGWSGRRCG